MLPMWFGYYVQMVAAFLLLAVPHYFTAAFLPIADCDETYNFLEPIHYLLYGSGKQTWENCPQFGLRSYLFAWVYAWPALLVRGASGLSSVDVYYFLRIFNGRLACFCELFFVYSVWAAFSGKAAVVALMLLLLNHPVPYAAASVLPTSLVMCCYFVALGCWLRTSSSISGSNGTGKGKGEEGTSASCSRFFVAATVWLVVFACIVGWPFAGLVAVPCGLDLLVRFPLVSTLSLLSALVILGGAAFAVDSIYYCRPTLSAWNVVKYNMFGGADRGPELYGVEPWFYFFKNLLLNFHLGFVAALAAPVVVLAKRRSSGSSGSGSVSFGVSRGRLLLCMSPFFLWLAFWTAIPHKEERFFAPAYPFLALAATVAVSHAFFPDVPGSVEAARRRPRGRNLIPFAAGMAFLLAFGGISFSRCLAVYRFYSGPERLLYDWAPLLRAQAASKAAAMGAGEGPASTVDALLNVCVGKEWYRFPSSFFADHRYMRYSFVKTSAFTGMLPVPFATPVGTGSSGGLLFAAPRPAYATAADGGPYGACACGAPGVNDFNREIPQQYVADAARDCDVIFDSLSSVDAEARAESAELRLEAFPHSLLRLPALEAAMAAQHSVFHAVDERYAVLDVDRTPLWCRVLYWPFGISRRCARWWPLILQSRIEPAMMAVQ